MTEETFFRGFKDIKTEEPPEGWFFFPDVCSCVFIFELNFILFFCVAVLIIQRQSHTKAHITIIVRTNPDIFIDNVF